MTRFIKMGAGQFLRDFRRDYHLQKSLAHRKSVLVRKEKLRKKQMKVHLAVISHDRSPGKKVSHTKLLSLAQEVKEEGFVSLYKKKELQLLCKGYAVAFLSKWNKKRLASALVAEINQHEHMPRHEETSFYCVKIVSDCQRADKIPILRVRRL